MKKLFTIVLMLIALTAVSIAQTARTGIIRTGGNMLTAPMAFTANDTTVTSDTSTITITNIQKYYQHQTFTTTLTAVSGTPSVKIKAYGRVTSASSWVQISDSVVWTSSANNPVTISSTTPANYNWLKLEYVASGATQKTKIASFDVRTSYCYDIAANSGTVTFSRATSGTVTLTSKDNNTDAALTIGAGGTGALTLGDVGSSTTITSSGTVAITASNVNIGATSANETTPALAIIADADSDAGGDTDEALTIDLTANATPTSAVWDITSTQSAGYRFDKSLTIGLATTNETLPVFSIRGDADSDAGGDTNDALAIVLTPNATPTSAVWDITSTQSNGYRFDKTLRVGPATADDVQPTLIVQGDADSDAGGDTQEALTVTLTPNATPTLATWGITSTQSAGYAFDKNVTFTGGYTIPNPSPVIWSKGGSTVLATSGTDVACSNGARWWVELDIPYNVTLTGITYLIGSVGATDSVVVQLCNSAGTQVATSRAVGGAAAIVGTAANFQSVPFTTTYAAVAGKYYAVLQFNGTTAKFRAYPIPGSKFITGTTAGTWGTKADITPGTTFTADKGPILVTY